MIQAAFQCDYDHSQFWNDPSKKYASIRFRCVFENYIAESNGRPPGDSNQSYQLFWIIKTTLFVSYNDDFSFEFHSVIAKKNKNTFDTQSSGFIDTVNSAKSQSKLDDDQPITTN
ncbi:hypothetical protein GJ496_007404 [Pomphorhynchus laevis]|nr:hypothetical protein GJ496_007404 [Pomphorhynchus laevis]